MFDSLWHILSVVRITATMVAIILIGLAIEKLDVSRINPELLTIGSFDHPETYRLNFSIPQEYKQKFFLDPFLVNSGPPSANLPNLTKLNWSVSNTMSKLPDGLNSSEQQRPFEPVMSSSQLAIARRLLQVFSELMISNGYGNRFWLTGGTLVGSYHFHDFIPWDDDVDVLADAEIRPDIQRLLKTLEPHYQTYTMYERDKLFTRPYNNTIPEDDSEMYSRYMSDKPWAWPFMDIGYYFVGPSSTCESTWRLGRGVCMPNSVIFPLIYRPFGVNWYPSPSNPPEYLSYMYQMRSSCVTFGYSHIFEINSQFARVPCYTLADRYAFMRHIIVPEAGIVTSNQTLSELFTVDVEQLMTADQSGRTTIHQIRLPIRRKREQSISGDYGIPEPR
ncbi:Lipopolysaccharide choline phosphotransferase protein [Fasciolopsis buskii]|uniref:Lipopolysaccharide choline phosphotransferase protein n=1 Tax=Fasciolopsis buskii TaxID=27845 RepID=A0A8E0RNS3_9TREM|nr:Lipopolysaccharide choline phosphotransferase protein [Fasciolopsis buski]